MDVLDVGPCMDPQPRYGCHLLRGKASSGGSCPKMYSLSSAHSEAVLSMSTEWMISSLGKRVISLGFRTVTTPVLLSRLRHCETSPKLSPNAWASSFRVEGPAARSWWTIWRRAFDPNAWESAGTSLRCCGAPLPRFLFVFIVHFDC